MNTALMTELLGGAARYKALRCFYEHADRAFGTRELAAEAGIDPGNASRWLRRWADVGLLERITERGQPLFRASQDPGLVPLKQLLQQDSEAAGVLREQLQELGPKVVAAALFGSAARGEAIAGSDLDVLLIATSLSRLEAQACFKPAGRQLGRPVNVQLYTPREWKAALDAGDPFVNDIVSNPMVMLKGSLHAA